MDLARFCDTISSLYSNLGKPLLDMLIFNYQLTQSIGQAGMIGLCVNYIITARLLRAVTPAFGKLAAIEAKLEGDFRGAHTRLITNAEEIAFYNGADLELGILQKSYTGLIKHINSILKIRITYNMFEDFLIKYAWSAVGLGMCAVPVFFPAWGGVAGRAELGTVAVEAGSRVGDRTRGFITNKSYVDLIPYLIPTFIPFLRLMLSLADAGGRLMYSYKEMAELAGHTLRVYSLISVLHSLHASEYYVPPSPPPQSGDTYTAPPQSGETYTIVDLQGVVDLGYNGIVFDGVPIVIPNPGSAKGELLVKDLKMHVGPGEHLMITGPNGVGKTAIARVVAGLWPVFRGGMCIDPPFPPPPLKSQGGQLSRPNLGDIFYIPQRPYLSIGSLRDQIIYPHSREDMVAAGRTDAELMEILRVVHLTSILDREGGWEPRREWKDVFSGGEKQRVGMARLFYHHPKYAVLDECTSAVSPDVEGLMYNHAKDTGISTCLLFLVSSTDLRDHGSWEFLGLGTPEQAMTVDKEVASLEEKLHEAEALRARLEYINGELNLKAGVHRREVLKIDLDDEDDLMGRSHLQTEVGRFEVEQIDLEAE
ncbi:ABC transporter transmembrane region 2-domain-containing protein [Jimgerdemannia flammicorona]|uniref:ABC transporter transmembrane region 2-domain-containing protein n=1 Tax=Jimgerdemannia flammicorona TaxID=994334 RepID=A0A433QGJ7_9FUNG|nr:ABC transporter transmembrane region 2-domain-containing protein [Jimgerdemannia flammicorona]